MDILEKASQYLLYEESKGCDKENTKLRAVLELLKLKARHGWSDASFSELLTLLAKLLPQPNNLPTSTYRAKKLICPLSLGVTKIHACLNHCVLYRKEYEFLTKCPICGVNRYKRSYNHEFSTKKNKAKKNKNSAIGPESDDTSDDEANKKKRKIPALVMWYLLVINHLRGLFSNPRCHTPKFSILGM